MVHEPFSQVVHYGDATIRGQQSFSEEDVISALLRSAEISPTFLKETTDFDYPRLFASDTFLAAATHVFLIRDPSDAIASHLRLRPALTSSQVGFARLYELYLRVGRNPRTKRVVLDTDDMVVSPAKTIKALCGALSIPYIPGSLSWEPGMIEEWNRSPRWHHDVAQSTGIAALAPGRKYPSATSHPLFHQHYNHHVLYYRKLRQRRLRIL